MVMEIIRLNEVMAVRYNITQENRDKRGKLEEEIAEKIAAEVKARFKEASEGLYLQLLLEENEVTKHVTDNVVIGYFLDKQRMHHFGDASCIWTPRSQEHDPDVPLRRDMTRGYAFTFYLGLVSPRSMPARLYFEFENSAPDFDCHNLGESSLEAINKKEATIRRTREKHEAKEEADIYKPLSRTNCVRP